MERAVKLCLSFVGEVDSSRLDEHEADARNLLYEISVTPKEDTTVPKKDAIVPKEGTVTKDRSTPEKREFWDGVEKAAEEVASWPAWKRGETEEEPSDEEVEEVEASHKVCVEGWKLRALKAESELEHIRGRVLGLEGGEPSDEEVEGLATFGYQEIEDLAAIFLEVWHSDDRSKNGSFKAIACESLRLQREAVEEAHAANRVQVKSREKTIERVVRERTELEENLDFAEAECDQLKRDLERETERAERAESRLVSIELALNGGDET
jgi:hypothetical protein